MTEDRQLLPRATESAQSPQEMVTVLGNVIDKPDACDRDDPWVEVTVQQIGKTLVIGVADTGIGMGTQTFERAMRGYSTKDGADHHGRGLALHGWSSVTTARSPPIRPTHRK